MCASARERDTAVGVRGATVPRVFPISAMIQRNLLFWNCDRITYKRATTPMIGRPMVVGINLKYAYVVILERKGRLSAVIHKNAINNCFTDALLDQSQTFAIPQ